MESKSVKMGLLALTLMTASNMMGSGVFMLPVTLGAVGWISIFGWLVTIAGVLALALVFAKTSMISTKRPAALSLMQARHSANLSAFKPQSAIGLPHG